MNNIVDKDISWLHFNHRVLQEANDETLHAIERLKFLGIFSNNLDEFYRVRMATISKIAAIKLIDKKNEKAQAEKKLIALNEIIQKQHSIFTATYQNVLQHLKTEGVEIVSENKLTTTQKKAVVQFFNKEVRSNIIPLIIEKSKPLPVLYDKSIYLACSFYATQPKPKKGFALISLPLKKCSRFFVLPQNKAGNTCVILLEDVIRFCLKHIFAFFECSNIKSALIKISRDAELDIDAEIPSSLSKKLTTKIKERKKAAPVRFLYDAAIDEDLFQLLTEQIQVKKIEQIAGDRILFYKDFMNFPALLKTKKRTTVNFEHASFTNNKSIQSVLNKQDVLLHFPYHSFSPIIDLLREAAIDPDVTSIQITCYRLAQTSNVANALINAARNGKVVRVILELKARFDEEANLFWKQKFEENNVEVYLGLPNKKIHGKLCVIKKVLENKTSYFGFISTGNLNEQTAKAYTDCCLLTSDEQIMLDVRRVFKYLTATRKSLSTLLQVKKLWLSPLNMRSNFLKCIQTEVNNVKKGLHGAITVKCNGLTDELIIKKLIEAAKAGVKVSLIVRGMFCMPIKGKKLKSNITAISIVDQYLEHARLYRFENACNPKFFISSADIMARNLDNRLEAACPIFDSNLQKELDQYLALQLTDNTKARNLQFEGENYFVETQSKKQIRAQVEIGKLLHAKTMRKVEIIT
jgi:polyphosphate kinase